MRQHHRRTAALPLLLQDLKAGRRRLMVCLGDSNTCNTNFTQGAKQWPELLHSALKDAAGTQTLVLVNAGVSGDSVVEALARFEHDVGRFRPDLCILCLGSNDANRLGDEAFRSGLGELLDRLAALGTTVLLRTPTPIMELVPLRIWPGDDTLRAKNAIIRELADARGLPFVDTYALWLEAERAGDLAIGSVMTDAVHTNNLGHRLVFRQLLPAFGLPYPGC